MNGRAYTVQRREAHRSGFTLVELLGVIAIIMMVIALLLPAASMLRRTAQRKAAATRGKSLSQAIKNYRQVYGQFPGQTQDDDDQDVEPDDILAALTNNPRRRIFVELRPEEVSADGELLDPWDMPYVIAMDETGDGRVELTASSGSISFSTNVPDQDVCVMSWGGRPEEEEARVYSWKR